MTSKYWMAYDGTDFSHLYKTTTTPGLPGVIYLGQFRNKPYDTYCGIKELSDEEATLYLLSLDTKPNV